MNFLDLNACKINSEIIIMQAYDQIRICRKHQKKYKKDFSHIINSAYEKIIFHKYMIDNYDQIHQENHYIAQNISKVRNIDDEMNSY